MKRFLLKIIAWKLGLIARLTISKYNPKIIGITGSVGKTSTKAALKAILKNNGINVRAAGGNLNNEIGLPLAILGDYRASGGFFFLSLAILKGFINLLFGSRRRYPEILILEYGADHPGDIDYLVKIAKPNISITTAVGSIPVHIEFYKNVSQLAAEKTKLVKAVSEDGAVVLNIDDPLVAAMKESTRGKVKTYGFNQEADLRISDFQNILKNELPVGIKFELKTLKEKSKVEILGSVGKSQAYSIAGAIAASLITGLSIEQSIKALKRYKGEKGRGKLIQGINDSLIIDDSYNASPSSTENALDILKNGKARKIAILGDMLELGGKSEDAHKLIGRKAGGIVDVLIAIGSHATTLTKAAEDTKITKANVHVFNNSLDAIQTIKELVKKGDLILVKGSQSIRTEKIVKALMDQPENAKDLLVRQYGKWLKS